MKWTRECARGYKLPGAVELVAADHPAEDLEFMHILMGVDISLPTVI